MSKKKWSEYARTTMPVSYLRKRAVRDKKIAKKFADNAKRSKEDYEWVKKKRR